MIVRQSASLATAWVLANWFACAARACQPPDTNITISVETMPGDSPGLSWRIDTPPNQVGPVEIGTQHGQHVHHVCVGPGPHSFVTSNHGDGSFTLSRGDGELLIPTFAASPPSSTAVAFSASGDAGIAACTLLYTQTVLSTVPGSSGVCADETCNQECQDKIDRVFDACEGKSYNTTDQVTGITMERGFSEEFARLLHGNGPADCDYSMGYFNCNSTCSMSAITEETELSFYELHRCVEVDAITGQSQANAVWHSCSDICQAKYHSLVAQCSGCEDQTMVSFLQDASSKLLKCVLDTAGCKSVRVAIHESCCITQSDCTATGLPPTCHSAPCARTVLSGANRCPDTYIHDSRLLGFFADCGGSLQDVGDRAQSLPGARFCHRDDHDRRSLQSSGLTNNALPMQISRLRQLSEEDPSTWEAHGASAACISDYQDVVTSSLVGACNTLPCNSECQRTITSLLQACRGDSYHESVGDGKFISRSWGAKVAIMAQHSAPPNCNYSLAFGGCDNSCTIADAGHTLGACARWGADYVFEGLSSCSEECKSNTIDLLTRCESCEDPIMADLMQRVSIALVSGLCLPSCDGVQGDDNPADAVQSALQEVCCAGDDCRSIGDWTLPSTVPTAGCAAAVKSVAYSLCPDIFFHDAVALGFFADCDGDALKLLSHGSPCTMPLSLPKWSSEGTCPPAGEALASGQYCQYFCEKGFCIVGTPPTCFAGRLEMGTSCEVEPTHSCQAPPNGGCDPLTSCTAEGDSIICGACPAGYFGQGDAGCHDIDECHVVPNGGCDPQTTCVNTAGGYECSACPPRFSGDGYKGCVSENTIGNVLSMGHHGDPSWSVLTLAVLAAVIAGITYAVVRLCSKKDVDLTREVKKVDVSNISATSIYDSTWAR